MKYVITYILSKQILITPGKYLNINLVPKSNIGDFIFLNKILLIRKNLRLLIGKPFVENITLFALILRQIKGPKLLVLRNRPKKNYCKKKGHRQLFSHIFIHNGT
jgi:large subunit ribosomal protein L21